MREVERGRAHADKVARDIRGHYAGPPMTAYDPTRVNP